MTKGLEALEKIDHTICMNNLENNIKWDIDKYDHCACVSVEDFVDCYEIIEKELKAPINLINKELRNARKLLPYDNYRCGYIDALITIKNKIKEQDNEK